MLVISMLIFNLVTLVDGVPRRIPISPGLSSWKVKGPGFMSKWEAGSARINPQNPKTLIADKTDGAAQELINKSKGSLDIYTLESFGDCTVQMEVMVAKEGNSGVYLMGRYEIQIRDSYGKAWFLESGDMGGIIDTAKPMLNAARKFGEWQTLSIRFKAPRFQNGKRVAAAEFMKVVLNGKTIQKNVRMEKGPTRGALESGESKKGRCCRANLARLPIGISVNESTDHIFSGLQPPQAVRAPSQHLQGQQKQYGGPD